MRLIDADALMDAMRDEEFQTFVPLDEVDGVIDKAPTVDAVPVVRCCQCKHAAIDWPTGKLCCARNGKVVGDEVWGGFAVDKNGYCNYGEKRDLEE